MIITALKSASRLARHLDNPNVSETITQSVKIHKSGRDQVPVVRSQWVLDWYNIFMQNPLFMQRLTLLQRRQRGALATG